MVGMTMKSKQILFTASVLMVTNLLVKFFGLLREILLAQYYGTSIYTDSYIIANNIPTVLFAALGASLATTFIPMYAKIREGKGEEEANLFTIHLVVIILIICAILTIIGELFTKQVVLIFASGFIGSQLDITISFTKILFPSIFGLALMNLMGSYLQLHDKFFPISLVPMFGNMTIIIALIISNLQSDIYFFVWGTVFGLVVQVLFYLPWVIKENLFSVPKNRLVKNKYIEHLFLLIIPVFLGEAVNEINSIVDRSLVSGLETGSVSYLNYSYKVINLVIGVGVVSLITIIYPRISKTFAKGNKMEFCSSCSMALNVIVTCIVPMTLLILFFKNDIIRILFQRGSFDLESTKMTTIALGCYTLGLIAMAVRELCAKIFYSMQDTRTPMKNGVACALINIVLDVILISLVGFRGAALATSIAAWIGALLLFCKLSKMGILKIKVTLILIAKCLMGAIVGWVFLMIWYDLLLTSCISNIIYYLFCMIGGILSFFLYICVQFVLKNNVLNSFRRL